ncbi:hypothetical protein F5H01DRAFT_334863 [Linnemannia elongata]|nr:hypothetical protein F5H01DRAFT_334860 [Linnemannia elongata]KAK5823622.1 hypothetical protein F5H01DRAFT_334863 [Linnemannia elongata]
MLKLSILVVLLLATTVAQAVPYTYLMFWSDAYRKGRKIICAPLHDDTCYRLPDDIANLGLSSASFGNGNMFANKMAVTLYSGDGCNGYMNRWGFTQNNLGPEYNIEYFQTLNDNVRSFKVAARDLPTTHGGARQDPENTERAPCKNFYS